MGSEMCIRDRIDTAFSDAGVNLDDFDTDEEITALTGILTYHVVSGKVMSTDLTDGMTATTLNGASLSISISEDGVVSINDAVVIIADVPVSNGVKTSMGYFPRGLVYNCNRCNNA